jgi:antitoxin component of MazEF toxin-antitoxin module
MSKARAPRPIKYDLKELVSGITPDNIHPEVDWGPDVGKEILPPWEGEIPPDLEG